MTTRRRSIGNLVAMAFLVAASLMARSWLADGLRYLAFGYIAGDLIFRAWAGYRRRRPHWTRDSWRGYLLACVVPAVALVIMVFMMAALEWKLPMVGASRSTTRGVWAGGTIAIMLVGVVGLVSAIEWLNDGDPTRQFALPRWLTIGRGKSA